MRKFVFYFFLIILQFSHILNIIVLPIEVKTKQKKNIDDPDEYYLHSELNIGEPNQLIDCEINFEIGDYYLTNYPPNTIPKYNFSLSKTFENTNQGISSSKFSDGYKCTETFYFYDDIKCEKKLKFEKMNIAIPSYTNKLYGCEIGFQSRHSNYGNSMSFVHELNCKKLYLDFEIK